MVKTTFKRPVNFFETCRRKIATSSNLNQRSVSQEEIKANIDVDRRNGRKPKRGRPYRLSGEAYKHMRSAVEHFLRVA